MLVEDAVARQLESDVPLSSLPRGRIDSSLVSAAGQRRSHDPLQTFNVRFSNAEYDETPAARAVAEAHHGLETQTLAMWPGQWRRLGARHISPLNTRVSLSPTASSCRHRRGGPGDAAACHGCSVRRTNMYPTPSNPAGGVFIELQVRSLRQLGVEVEVLHFDRRSRGAPSVLGGLAESSTRAVERTQPALVHIAYGGVLAELATRAVRDPPLLVQYSASDLLGSRAERPLRRFTIHVGVLASRRAALRASGVIVVSENLRAALPDGAAHGNVWVLASGVDPDRFQPLDQHECRSRLGWTTGSSTPTFPHRRDGRRSSTRSPKPQSSSSEQQGSQVELHALDGVAHTDVPTWMNASDVVLLNIHARRLSERREGSPRVERAQLLPWTSETSASGSRKRGGMLSSLRRRPVTWPRSWALCSQRAGPVDGRTSLAEISLLRTAHKLLDIYRTILG